jgi:hypothetical protein
MAIRAKKSVGLLVAMLTILALHGGPASALGPPASSSFGGGDVKVIDMLGAPSPTATHTDPPALPFVVEAEATVPLGSPVGSILEPDVFGGGIRVGLNATRGTAYNSLTNNYTGAATGTTYTVNVEINWDTGATFATGTGSPPTIPSLHDAGSSVRVFLEVDYIGPCPPAGMGLCLLTATGLKSLAQWPAFVPTVTSPVTLSVMFTPTGGAGNVQVRTGVIADASAIGGPNTAHAKGKVTGITVTITP